jgi:hypothetical protein
MMQPTMIATPVNKIPHETLSVSHNSTQILSGFVEINDIRASPDIQQECSCSRGLFSKVWIIMHRGGSRSIIHLFDRVPRLRSKRH